MKVKSISLRRNETWLRRPSKRQKNLMKFSVIIYGQPHFIFSIVRYRFSCNCYSAKRCRFRDVMAEVIFEIVFPFFKRPDTPKNDCKTSCLKFLTANANFPFPDFCINKIIMSIRLTLRYDVAPTHAHLRHCNKWSRYLLTNICKKTSKDMIVTQTKSPLIIPTPGQDSNRYTTLTRHRLDMLLLQKYSTLN